MPGDAGTVRLARISVRARAAALVGPLLLPILGLGAGCGSRDVILGKRLPDITFDDAGRRVAAINSDFDDDNPTFTGDLLQIYFTSGRPGSVDDDDDDGDVWCAERASRVDAFGEARLVESVSSPDATETSVAVDLDGLALWVGSNRADPSGGSNGTDIWQATRPPAAPGEVRGCFEGWGAPRPVPELNSPYADIPRPLGLGGLVMPIASRRADLGGDYLTYFASRSSPDGTFDTPDRAPLAALEREGRTLVDAFLSDDGRFLFFNRSQANGNGDLFMSWRATLDEPFEQEVDLGVNTTADERDPWLNPDGTRFFFSRDSEERGLDIYGTAIDLTVFR